MFGRLILLQCSINLETLLNIKLDMYAHLMQLVSTLFQFSIPLLNSMNSHVLKRAHLLYLKMSCCILGNQFKLFLYISFSLCPIILLIYQQNLHPSLTKNFYVMTMLKPLPQQYANKVCQQPYSFLAPKQKLNYHFHPKLNNYHQQTI